MTIDEAIEILEHKTNLAQFRNDPTMMSAIKLGIESLKREKGNREDPDYFIVRRLPGETKE